MENVTIDLSALYEEIKDRAFTDGAFSREEWGAMVDDVLEEKREVGESHDDVDWEEMREALRARYEDFAAELPEA